MTLSEIATILAGFFAGLCVALLFVINLLISELQKERAERKRWVNKVLVREGHPQLFPDSEVESETPNLPKPDKKTPLTMVSPLRSAQQKIRNGLVDDKKTEAGANVPDQIKSRISEAAEKVRGEG